MTVRHVEGASWAESLEHAINEETAIVAVPQCHWTDGSKIDLERVGRRARGVGAALVIDASQSLGACPLDLDRVQPDFLVAVGYKWLLGPTVMRPKRLAARVQDHQRDVGQTGQLTGGPRKGRFECFQQ